MMFDSHGVAREATSMKYCGVMVRLPDVTGVAFTQAVKLGSLQRSVHTGSGRAHTPA